VWAGVTSLEELKRVLGEHADDSGAGASLAHPGPAGVQTPELSVAPAASAAPAASTAPADESAAPDTGRILIADDDPQMRRLIRIVLQRDGFEVVEANDGLDALDVIEQGRVDLVILDVDMPRLNGLGVLEEIRAQMRTASLPVIVLTALQDETEEKALDLGAQDYLTKPVQTRSLVARVRAVLKRAKS
jgi:CheY-like chemotaxis protein